MSSAPLSSKKNLFVQSQGPYSNPATSTTGNPNTSMFRQSPVLSPLPTATRIRVPKPFYRSRVTPDPFDYSNSTRRQSDSLDYAQPSSQRRYSVNQLNGSALSSSYGSDQESSGPAMTSRPFYRSTTPTSQSFATNNRPVISVSSSPSPVITIAPGTALNRSEIRFSTSPNSTKPRLRAVSMSRADSPSRQLNPPAVFNHHSIDYPSNGQEKPFQITVGSPARAREPSLSPTIHMFGRTGASLPQMDTRRDSTDNRLPSNLVANRFTPLLAFTTPNRNKSPIFDSNAGHRSPALVNLPPASSVSSATPSALLNGHSTSKAPSSVDQLRKLLMKSMNASHRPNFFGMCARCNDEILGEENGLVAMDRMYHVACFTCTMCGARLRGMHFYSMENQPYCELCYVNSLEKCVVCAGPITDRVLRATGKTYHSQCFCCTVCRKSLDGVPFTIDIRMDIHCIDCFHQKFAPRCCVCHQVILPEMGQGETIRIVALDRNYHIDCYRCENCQAPLTDDEGCYPINDHVFCIHCHRLYSKAMLNHP